MLWFTPTKYNVKERISGIRETNTSQYSYCVVCYCLQYGNCILCSRILTDSKTLQELFYSACV